MAKSAKPTKTAKKGAKKAKKSKLARVSYHHRPENMQLDLWQLGLRKQFGEESDFHITNTGPEPIFSEFIVWNPASRNSYTVTIRAGLPKKGLPPENTLTRLGNTCSCQDFKTNRLGLCKHIGAVLHQVRKKWGAKKALAAGMRPPYSMIYVDYRREPRIRLFVGADLLIIDEARRIKNFRTKVSIQLKKVQTPYCFVLTGTPLENKLEDLYAVTQFVDQYKLPPLYRFLDRYQILGDNGQVTGYKNLKEIGGILADCLIRRVKKQVLRDLPKRLDKVLFVPMTQQQRDIHSELADAVARLVAKWRRFHFPSETDRRILMLCLSQMRMVADSTFILDQQTRFDTKIAELMYILEEALANPGQKVVVFSQWERMTRLVAQELEARDAGFAYLHGAIPSAERADLLIRFREDPHCRVFLSTESGGVGLNLQSAALLVNLDIPWNPAVLEQRVGRIHRMGQKHNVTVINMVSAESIEQRLLNVLKFKSSMAEGVLDPDGDDTIFMSSSKFKKFMENVETLTGDGWQAPTSDATDMGPDSAEAEDFELPPAPSAPESEAQHTSLDDFPETDDSKPPKPPTPKRQSGSPQTTRQTDSVEGSKKSGTDHTTATPATPRELIQTGVAFFSGLTQTLGDPEKTRELVQSIVATDEETGQTYLKNAEVVENAVRLLGGLLAGLGRG